MSELDRWTAAPERRPPDALGRRPPGAAVDRHRERGLDLTPEEIRVRRSNRRWLLGLAVPSIAILALALIASGVAERNQPNGPRASAPAGYKAVRDGYYSYVVPVAWSTNPAYTDSAGDVDTAGPSGWAAEHIAYRATPPAPGEAPPTVLEAFGMPSPTPFQLVGGHPVDVPGATSAFAYTMTRPGGFQATVIDAWSVHTAVELWLVVHAPAATTQAVVGSLLG